MSRCRSCGAEIIWIRTKAGKQMPVDTKTERFIADPEGDRLYVMNDGHTMRGTPVRPGEENAAGVSSGQYRLRPLYYVTDKDKAWYKEAFGVRYSDAYEVYGLERTGCCGCPISYRAVDDLEKIRPYEPNVVKAAWNVFGRSYEYRRLYNEYKRRRMEQESQIEGQINIDEWLESIS